MQRLSKCQVRASRTIISYAVSPQTQFIGSPCSVYARTYRDGAHQRHTFCAIRTPKPQLICFFENFDGESHVKIYIRDYDFEDDPVISLEVQGGDRHSDGYPRFRLLVVQASGHIDCLSQTLEEELWTTKVPHTHKGNGRDELAVRQAVWVSSVQVANEILKERQDVIALVNESDRSNHARMPLLLTVTDESGSLSVSLYRLANRSSSPGESGTKTVITTLTSTPLPIPTLSTDGHAYADFKIDVARGIIIQMSQDGFFIIGLNGFLPTLNHSIRMKNSHPSTVRVLSSGTAVTVVRSIIDIVNLRYSSIKASQDPSLLTGPLLPTNLDQRNQPKDPQKAMSILGFIRRLRIIVILKGRQVFACSLEDTVVSQRSPRKRKRDIGICESLSQGISQDLLISSAPFADWRGQCQPMDKIWERRRRHLDKILKSGALDEFTEAVFHELKIPDVPGNLTSDPMSSWAVQSRSNLETKKVDYLMARLFRIDRAADVSQRSKLDPLALIIQILPEKLHHWLVVHGFFTRNQIEASLRREGLLHGAERLSKVALATALVQWDPHLKSALLTVTNAFQFDTQELVLLLSAYLDSINAQMPSGETKFFAHSVAPTAEYASSQKRQGVTNELELCLASSDASKEILGDFLDALLICLQKRPTGEISKALRVGLLPKQLRTLINVLRLRLAGGGWLTPYYNSIDLSSIPGSGDVASIMKLLDCALNVMGIIGWSLGPSVFEELVEIAETIGYMKAEVSAAVEGMLDAKRLEDTLGQMLLYEKRVNWKGIKSQRPQRSLHAQEPSLPVGILKPADIISPCSVGAGGVLQKRTARDIGRLKSRAVGKYTFDRINI